MISYKNDPLLFDGTNNPHCYRLFKDVVNKHKDLIFLPGDFLNLYSVLVKRNDFKKHNNQQNIILRRVPYFCGSNVKSLFINLLNKKYNHKTRYKQFREEVACYCGLKERIPCSQFNNWITKKEIPFPAARVLSLKFKDDREVLSFFVKRTSKIKGARNTFLPPLTISSILQSKNQYLIGAAFGDGGFETESSWIILDGGKNDDEVNYSNEYLKFITRLLTEVYKIDKVRKYHYHHKIVLGVDNKFFCRFINFFYDLPFGSKDEKLKVPKIFKGTNENFFWRGLGDTDGSYRKFSKTFSIGMKQSNLIKELSSFLNKNTIKHNIRGVHLNVFTEGLCKFAKVVGSSHPRKQKELINQLSSDPTHRIFQGVDKEKLHLGNFNLLLIPHLRVYLGNKSNLIFKDLSVSQIMDRTKVSRQTIHNWKNGLTAVPFSIMGDFHKNNILHLLGEKSLFSIGLKGSNKAYLPARFDEKMLKYASLVRPTTRGLHLNVRKNPLALKHKKEIEEYFEVTFNYVSSKEYRCESSILNTFFKTFFIYDKPWKSFSEGELVSLKKEWDSFC